MRIRTRAAGLVLAALVSLPGCGSDELDSPTAVKLKALSNFYLEYAVAQHGRGPANEDALKKHIRSQPDFILKTNGIEPSAIEAAVQVGPRPGTVRRPVRPDDHPDQRRVGPVARPRKDGQERETTDRLRQR